ncbi:ABC transporter substrate-binding protein [Bacillus niameyensis]|uniref:ABC transporter substrate-binding protein n=1 Tax=Bacillus niameyensis TaxID=1522308 RepID=UPI0007849BD8|nr:extracellular solute-binding protein [Bacillus niameyensis]
MKRKFKLMSLFVVIAFLASFIVACGNNAEPSNSGNENSQKEGESAEKDNGKEEEEQHEEVTIRWAHQWEEDHFWDNYGDLLKEKFPYVTIELQQVGTDHPETLQEVIAAGKTPDVVTLGIVSHIQFLDELGLAFNHDSLIEQSGFDLSNLEPSIVEFTRGYDPKDEKGLYAIPNSRPTWALHYNKDVFDILGENYPEDGMTWEEVVELAKKLTREVNGVQYYGLDLDVPYDAWTQLNVQSVDPDTDEVVIANSEEYKQFFKMIDDTLSIPGYPTEEPGSMLMHWGGKWDEGIFAMRPSSTGWLDQDNIDIATYPVWDKENPLMPRPNAGGFAITGTSEHKEIIMEMISYLLSEEVQIEKSKEGQSSILVSPDVQAAFGENKPEWEGKNLDALFKYGYAVGPEKPAKYGSIPWGEFQEFANSGMDVNEYLRVYQEKMEELVRKQKETE